MLVTGATGAFGSATIHHLLAQGIAANQIVALVRDEAKAAELTQTGVRVRQGDYDDYASLVQAFTGVEKVLLVSGSDIFKRSTQHQNAIRAAQEAGVKHLVYTSFLGKNNTETSALWMVAQSHLQTESWLKESGMDYTILQNTLYMDFIPAFLGEQVLESGMIYLPAGEGKVGAVLRTEMAEAAAKVLTGHTHAGKTYRFTHTEAFSYPEIAELLSAISGKSIQYQSPSASEYAQTMLQHGMPEAYVGLFSGFAVAQALGELETVSTDLADLLGRKPTTIEAFLKQVYGTAKH